MKDQYGGEVPDDLVVLNFGQAPSDEVILFDPVDPEEVGIITAADWYEVEGQEGLILASFEAIQGMCEADPLDCGINLAGMKIHRIATPLKRYSWEAGFYHA